MAQLTGYDYFLENALTYGWMVPQGAILLWSGLIANIPAGWVFCNGSNSTPDLRDKFVVGAKQDDGGVAKTNVSGALTQSGGALSHDHHFVGSGHSHGMSYQVEVDIGSGYYVWEYGQFSDNGSAEGETDPANVLPPYYALAFIMKT